MSSTPDLRTALAAMIYDYRTGEIPTPDASHVDRWVSQFPAPVRDPILSELLHVFRWTYFSRDNVQRFIDSIVVNANFAGANPCEFWQGVKVLNLQTAGNSQKDMLKLLEDSIQRQCGLAMESCGVSPHTYLYLDDAVFSGGRVRSDVIKWIKEAAPAKAKLVVLVIGLHRGGEWYSTRVRTHLSHQMTVAAMAMVAMKVLMLRSKRVATLRQSLKRQNMRSMTLRCL